MKTQFKVNILSNGSHLTDIVTMVANHNGNVSKIDMDIICGYLMARKTLYPTLHNKTSIVTDLQDANTIHLSDDNGQSFYMSITECEIEELAPEFIAMDELVSTANEILNSKI